PRHAAFAPDGWTLAVAGTADVAGKARHRLTLCDLATLKQRSLPEFPQQVTFLAFSPDGKTLNCIFGETFAVLDATTGKELARYERMVPAASDGVVISPGGLFLATLGYDRRIRLFHIPDLLDKKAQEREKAQDGNEQPIPNKGDKELTAAEKQM